MSQTNQNENDVWTTTAALTALGIPVAHSNVGIANLMSSHREYRKLLYHRRLPDKIGWSDVQIQHFLFTLSTLDTNSETAVSVASNDVADSMPTESMLASRWCGVGEREGRVYSTLVQQRHFGFSHGMGRSGDINEPQPKAVGSSVLAKLTKDLSLDVIRRGAGMHATTTARCGILLPTCTGMSISLVLSSFRDRACPDKSIVLWSRMDQKSCLKAITSTGLQCIVIPTILDGENDAVGTNVVALDEALQKYHNQVLAVITTTSCFAPRVPDAVDEVAKLCQRDNVHHIINNAYGLQCFRTTKLINRACVVGRVDAIVCSMDKNFLVPVGGAIIISPSEQIIDAIGKIYPGRASSTAVVDLFITLMSMGIQGYKRLLQKRHDMIPSFVSQFETVAMKYGERCLICPTNTISFGMTLDGLIQSREETGVPSELNSPHIHNREYTRLGAMLFTRCVSGTRVIPKDETKIIHGVELPGFGSSVVGFPHVYLTAACAIGLNDIEAREFFHRLDGTLAEFQKQQQQQQQQQQESTP
jgi:O-phospho-L-seryl-tRNASec:L-selenocysteinyl-tRNA synthase